MLFSFFQPTRGEIKMTDFVPFEPNKGLEGNFIPYEVIEEGLVVIDDKPPQQLPLPFFDSVRIEKK